MQRTGLVIGGVALAPMLASCTGGDPLLETTEIPSVDSPLKSLTFPGSVILGRPTGTSITYNLLSSRDCDVFIKYGAASQTPQIKVTSGQPQEIVINGLTKDTPYDYILCHKPDGQTGFFEGITGHFHTQRPPGNSFVFTVEADYHRDTNSDPVEIRQTFANITQENPDFDLDLGDTFMCEKFATSYTQVVARYVEDRDYYGIIGSSAPLFLVMGNHDGELGWLLNGTQENIAVWATKARKLYYPNPFPNDFYSGGTKMEPFVGQRQNYYSWVWGDALFVVLDMYWYTADGKEGSDTWNYTLGSEQYQWFRSTQENSTQKFKFVFAHHALGNVRGGIEWADYFEWGGRDRNGTWEFDKMRPGWGKPVHQVMAENGVTIFFQGHDHLYVRQERDSVIYQEVPQPSVAPGQSGAANDGSYKSGVDFPSPGHLRVSVSPQAVTVEYVFTALPGDNTAKYTNGHIVNSYTVV